MPLRDTIGDRLRALVGSGDGAIDLTRHGDDDGLIARNSVAWRVHGDFTTMMAGGIAALLLQMLHPGALAGVWDHSAFRKDMAGRLRRTAQFVAGTTYGGTAEATRLIDRVRSVHDRVAGHLPDGTPYSANDPALLTWVHAAEAECFLRGFLSYREPAMSAADQDGYFADTAVIAERLGAAGAPLTRRAMQSYFVAIQPELRFDARTRDVQQSLLEEGFADPALGPFGALMREAAIDLLPAWAQRMHGFAVTDWRRPAVRLSTSGVARIVRWALH